MQTGADFPASALDRSHSPPAASLSAGEAMEKPICPPSRPPKPAAASTAIDFATTVATIAQASFTTARLLLHGTSKSGRGSSVHSVSSSAAAISGMSRAYSELWFVQPIYAAVLNPTTAREMLWNPDHRCHNAEMEECDTPAANLQCGAIDVLSPTARAAFAALAAAWCPWLCKSVATKAHFSDSLPPTREQQNAGRTRCRRAI